MGVTTLQDPTCTCHVNASKITVQGATWQGTAIQIRYTHSIPRGQYCRIQFEPDRGSTWTMNLGQQRTGTIRTRVGSSCRRLNVVLGYFNDVSWGHDTSAGADVVSLFKK